MMKRTPEGVTIELTSDQFDSLLLQLGYAAGAATLRGEPLHRFLRLVNAINEGNPDWTPYEVADDAQN